MISAKHVIAKVLRKNFTNTERVLWKHLRAKQMEGCKFRRQEPIGSYVVDFVCHEKRIVIEVDGGQHSTERERDYERDEWLKGQGYKVLRFWNNEVLANIEGVLEVIRDSLNHPPLSPPLKGGEIREEPPIEGGEIIDSFHRKTRRTYLFYVNVPECSDFQSEMNGSILKNNIFRHCKANLSHKMFENLRYKAPTLVGVLYFSTDNAFYGNKVIPPHPP